MASSDNQSQESGAQIPSGESAPFSSSNFKNQKHSWPSVPLSPQLRYALSRKQPRIPVSLPASSCFSPSPITVASIENGSYFKVPARWFPDNRVWSRDFYLSRNSLLLKKVIHGRVLGRIYENQTEEEFRKLYSSAAIIVDGSPDDCWLTFPIQPPFRLENSDPPRFKGLFQDENEPSSIAYVNRPVKSTRYSMKLFGDLPQPHYDGLPFPWVTITTGTNFLDRWSFNLDEVEGHVECPVCGEIWSLQYGLPEKFDRVDIQLDPIGERINEEGEEVLKASEFSCKCDGKENPVRPIISDHLHKINWMFLFLGFGIGFCTIDQLKYYCMQRSLPLSDNKKKILLTVFDDLCQQIFLRRVGA